MEVTVQTDQLLVIRRRRSGRVWCETCGREVETLDPQEAGKLAAASQPLLAGKAGPEAWHMCVGHDGQPLICLESLLKGPQSGNTSNLE